MGGMFGFYRTGDGVYELRSNDSVVTTSHGDRCVRPDAYEA